MTSSRRCRRFSAATMSPEAGGHQRSRAILVGVADYIDAEFPAVPAALNSLKALYDVLTNPRLCAWPSDRVTVLSNPHNAGETARSLRWLARDVQDVLLVYYVGHGKLTTKGQLCLTVTDTSADAPDFTGISYEWIAESLRESPARVKITLLDCCFSGQAIEALTAASPTSSVADFTHVAGVYTLTATTRNKPAHVPPSSQQQLKCTSFTGELIEIVESGIEGGPAKLTFSDIYPHLRQRLTLRGLPQPAQRGTDTVDKYVFTNNVARQPDPLPPSSTAKMTRGAAGSPTEQDSETLPRSAADRTATRIGHAPPDMATSTPLKDGDETAGTPSAESGREGAAVSRSDNAPNGEDSDARVSPTHDKTEKAVTTPVVNDRIAAEASGSESGALAALPSDEETTTETPAPDPERLVIATRPVIDEDTVGGTSQSDGGRLATASSLSGREAMSVEEVRLGGQGGTAGTTALTEDHTTPTAEAPTFDHEGSVHIPTGSATTNQAAKSRRQLPWRLFPLDKLRRLPVRRRHLLVFTSVVAIAIALIVSLTLIRLPKSPNSKNGNSPQGTASDNKGREEQDVDKPVSNEPGDRLIATLEGHGHIVSSVAFSPNGMLLASGSDDETARLWDTETHELIGILENGHASGVTSLEFSPNGDLLATGSRDASVGIWDIETHTLIENLEEGDNEMDNITSVAFSPDGSLIARASWLGTVQIWTLDSGELVETLEHDAGEADVYSRGVNAVVFSPDGRLLASGMDVGTIVLWDTETYERIDTLDDAVENSMSSLAFSPDGDLLASGNWDGTVAFWDTETHKLIDIWDAHNTQDGSVENWAVTSLAFSPDGQQLATGSWDGTVALWDTETYEHIETLAEGNNDEDHNNLYGRSSVAFSSDGRQLASSYDRTVQLWSLADL